MADDAISYDAYVVCTECGSSNILREDAAGGGTRLHAERPLRSGDWACNNCGHAWTPLPADVRDELDHAIAFDGRNGFIGAGGKENMIRRLRAIAARHGTQISGADIEAFLASRPGVNPKGPARAAKWYDEIQGGVRHRDYARRTIE